MDDAKLLQMLNRLATRSVMLECQLLSMRGLLRRSGILPDAEFEAAMKLAMDTYKEILSDRKTDSERMEEFLRKFEGPIQ